LFPFQPNQFDAFHLAMQLLRDPNAATQVLQPVHRFTVDTFKITGCWLLWRKQGIVSRPSAGALDPAIIGKAGRKTVLAAILPALIHKSRFESFERERTARLQHRKDADQSLLDVIAFSNLFGKILLPDLFMEIHVWAFFLFGDDHGMTFHTLGVLNKKRFQFKNSSLNC
jgi:hypothetical protein